MATTFSRNLKLRIADTLTADAVYNLNKIDTLGESTLVDSIGTARIRSKSDIALLPNNSDIGGSGLGGVVTIGETGSNISTLSLFTDLTELKSGTLHLDNSVLEISADTEFKVALAAPTGLTSTLNLTLPGVDGASGEALITDGSGVLSWASFVSSSLIDTRIEIGNSSGEREAVDLSVAGDILASTVTGLTIKDSAITNSHIVGNAAISLTKLEALTADRLLVSTSSGVVAASTITTTEVGYLSGLTGNIQGQLDAISGTNQLSSTWLSTDGNTISITHGFSTRSVSVQVLDSSNDYANIELDSIKRPNDNQVVLVATEAPTSSWLVLIQQIGV